MHGSAATDPFDAFSRATKEKVKCRLGRPRKVRPIVIAIDSDSTSSHQEIGNEPPTNTEDTEVKKTRTFYTIKLKKQIVVYAQNHSAVMAHEFFGIPRTTINRRQQR